MAGKAKLTPAVSWRAFFIFAVCAVTSVLAGPPTGGPPPLAQVGKPDAAESARILEKFRQSGWYGYVEFELRALPRRGAETVYRGRLWGGQNDQGAVTRIEVADAKGGVHRFLLQNGQQPGVWRTVDGKVVQVVAEAMFQPLIRGVEVTPFDLLMPYLYWPGGTVESVARVRGRPAYVFSFVPPPAVAAQNEALKRVKAYFDAQFNAPVQTELLASRQVIKTTSLVDLKKVGEDWIPKSFDIRNDLTRDKTRFEVTAVALRLEFAPTVFAPAHLAEEVRPPAADRIVRVER